VANTLNYSVAHFRPQSPWAKRTTGFEVLRK
jgi:hypothetical protein